MGSLDVNWGAPEHVTETQSGAVAVPVTGARAGVSGEP